MPMKPDPAATIAALNRLGQSVWLDELRREWIKGGELQRLIDVGVGGVTLTTSGFESALETGDAYDASIRQLTGPDQDHEIDLPELALALLSEDARDAAGLLGRIHERSGRRDGFVSVQVPPDLADQTGALITAARQIWSRCDRPNVMVEVPATEAGVAALRILTEEGINVHASLISSPKRYEAVVESYSAGLEARLGAGRPLEGLAGMAGFSVRWIDAAIDPMLTGEAASLRDKAGIAICKLAYQSFLSWAGGERGRRLVRAGAAIQRCLWRAPAGPRSILPPDRYIVELAGPQTVTAVPRATLETLSADSIRGPRLLDGVGDARELVDNLTRFGVDPEAAGDTVTRGAVARACRSYRHSLELLATRRHEAVNAYLDRQVANSFPASDPPSAVGHSR